MAFSKFIEKNTWSAQERLRLIRGVRKFGIDYNRLAEFIRTDKGATEIKRIYNEDEHARTEMDKARAKYNNKKSYRSCNDLSSVLVEEDSLTFNDNRHTKQFKEAALGPQTSPMKCKDHPCEWSKAELDLLMKGFIIYGHDWN